MKKIKILFLICIIGFEFIITKTVSGSSLITNEESPTALGKTINCVTATSYGNLSTGYVLDRDYYDTICYDINVYDTGTKCCYYTETTSENVKYKKLYIKCK